MMIEDENEDGTKAKSVSSWRWRRESLGIPMERGDDSSMPVAQQLKAEGKEKEKEGEESRRMESTLHKRQIRKVDGPLPSAMTDK
jgi:hypothetical protein